MYNPRAKMEEAKANHDKYCMGIVKDSIYQIEKRIVQSSQEGFSQIQIDYGDLNVPESDVEEYASNTKRFYQDALKLIKNELKDKYTGLKFKLVRVKKTWYGNPYVVLEIRISW